MTTPPRLTDAEQASGIMADTICEVLANNLPPWSDYAEVPPSEIFPTRSRYLFIAQWCERVAKEIIERKEVAGLVADNARLRGELAEAEAAVRDMAQTWKAGLTLVNSTQKHAPAIARAQERRG